MRGKIISVFVNNSIVSMTVQNDKTGLKEVVNWDWRMFKNFSGAHDDKVIGLEVDVENGEVYALDGTK